MKKEIWKDIKGYEGLYQVSNMGRVKSLARLLNYRIKGFKMKKQEIIMQMSPNLGGYNSLILYKGKKYKRICRTIHRLVATAFIPNPGNKKTINHKDGNKKNNNVNNLEWNTLSENIRHAYKLGLKNHIHLTGENNPLSKLKLSDIQEIKELAKNKAFTQRNIAELYGCSQQNISRIILGKQWHSIKSE